MYPDKKDLASQWWVIAVVGSRGDRPPEQSLILAADHSNLQAESELLRRPKSK